MGEPPAGAEPLVSILVPVYNRERLVREAIESAIAQTYRRIEVVVCDNASTDGTEAACRALAARDPRVRYFRNPENVGPVRNWAECARHARGEYAKVLFSDDVLAPTCVERMVDEVRASGPATLVYSPCVIGERPWEGTLEYAARPRREPSAEFGAALLAFGGLPFSPFAYLVPMSALRDALAEPCPATAFDDHLKHGAGPDLHIVYTAARRASAVARTEKAEVFFRAHAGSITMAAPARITLRYVDYALTAVRAHRPAASARIRRKLGSILLRIVLRGTGERLAAIRVLFAHLRARPPERA